MLLFKPEHVELITAGLKTQTRRLWKRRRAKPGSLHGCYTRPPFVKNPGKPFARIHILAVYQEVLGEISLEDCYQEGYLNREQFFAAWFRINRSSDLTAVVWVVSFECEEDLT